MLEKSRVVAFEKGVTSTRAERNFHAFYLLLAAPDAFEAAWNWVDAFLRAEHHKKAPALYGMLRQALAARRTLILLDGLDEGGAARSLRAGWTTCE